MNHREQMEALLAGKWLRYGPLTKRLDATGYLEARHESCTDWAYSTCLAQLADDIEIVNPEPERRTGLTLAECVQLGKEWRFWRPQLPDYVYRTAGDYIQTLVGEYWLHRIELVVPDILANDWEAVRE